MGPRGVVRSLLALVMAGCASFDATSGPIVLTGSYVGFQDGTDGMLTFEGDPFDLILLQSGDSVTGTWISTVGGVGTIAGEILPSDLKLEFTMRLVQTEPCAGVFTGLAETRISFQPDGSTILGIIGNYSGDDCDSTTDAGFFVERPN